MKRRTFITTTSAAAAGLGVSSLFTTRSQGKEAMSTSPESFSPDKPRIFHCIRYTIDPHKITDFEVYARRWMEDGIIRRCGGEPLGYFLPKKGLGGADNIALALIGFESLSAYEAYRGKLIADPDAKENLAFAEKSRCILVEERSYFYHLGEHPAKE
jgi:NIPSNAP